MWKYLVGVISILVSVGTVYAAYDYQPLVIPSPVNPTELMRPLDIVDNGDILLESSRVGARLPNGSTTPQIVSCPRFQFLPSPTTIRQGPEVRGMNNSGVIAASGIRADNKSVGILSYPNGQCTAYLVAGSVGTVATAIADDGTAYGYYWNATGGLERFHGYRRAPDGTITILQIPEEPNSSVYPTKADSNGNFIGYAYRNIGSDNSYTFQGLLYINNSYIFLDYITGEDVWLVGWNSEKVLAVVAQDVGIDGGKAVLYDRANGTFTVIPLPTPDSTSLSPKGINMTGVLVGSYLRDIGTADNPILVNTQFKATPIPDATPASTPATPSLQKQMGHKAWRAKPFRRIKAGKQCPIYQYLRSSEKGE